MRRSETFRVKAAWDGQLEKMPGIVRDKKLQGFVMPLIQVFYDTFYFREICKCR